MIAGTNDPSVIVYDLETRTPVLSLNNHRRDVNAVCVGDPSSPYIVYTGSDDATLRVWDRRSMGSGREAGVFLGHREGLTYVDSKADGRYVLSNGKDQLMKLWDLRKMMTMSQFNDIKLDLPAETFDYQISSYPREDYRPHPNDCSLVTFRGHQVLKTLNRCRFSPPGSTNSRYVYTASSDGKVYIYNLDATLAGTIDVRLSTMFSRPQDDDLRIFEVEHVNNWVTCVRDASWHPSAPVLAGEFDLCRLLCYELLIKHYASYILERMGDVFRHMHLAFLGPLLQVNVGR
jgi:DDB1- and CUL4-associated factor 11